MSVGYFEHVESVGSFEHVDSMGSFKHVESVGSFEHVDSLGSFEHVESARSFRHVESTKRFCKQMISLMSLTWEHMLLHLFDRQLSELGFAHFLVSRKLGTREMKGQHRKNDGVARVAELGWGVQAGGKIFHQGGNPICD